MSEKLNLAEIGLNEITDIGVSVPVGQYVCRLSQINPKPGDENKSAAVETVFDILEGDYEGMEIRIYYTLSVTRSEKNGKIYAPGISDAKAAAAAVERPFPADYRFKTDPVEAAKAIGERLHPTKVARLVIAVWEDEYTTETGEKKKTFRRKVIGLQKTAQAGKTLTAPGGVSGVGVPPPASGQNVLESLNLA